MSFSKRYISQTGKARKLVDKALKKIGVKRKTPFDKYKENLAKYRKKVKKLGKNNNGEKIEVY